MRNFYLHWYFTIIIIHPDHNLKWSRNCFILEDERGQPRLRIGLVQYSPRQKVKSWTPTFICRNIVVDFLIMAQYRYSLEAVVVRTHAADETGRSMLWREWGVLMFFWKWLWKKNIFRRIWRTSPRIMNWEIKVKARNCLPGKQNYTW